MLGRDAVNAAHEAGQLVVGLGVATRHTCRIDADAARGRVPVGCGVTPGLGWAAATKQAAEDGAQHIGDGPANRATDGITDGLKNGPGDVAVRQVVGDAQEGQRLGDGGGSTNQFTQTGFCRSLRAPIGNVGIGRDALGEGAGACHQGLGHITLL